MPKVKITDQESWTEGPGPLPDGPDDLMDGPRRAGSSPSIGGEGSKLVTEAFAGDLIALPFEAAHIINPVIDPLSKDERARIAVPFANIMNKYDLGAKLSRDEIVFAFYLTAAIAARAQAAAAAKKLKKAQEEMIEKNLEADKGFES